MRLTRLAFPSLLLAAATTAGAQGVGDVTVAAIPQYVSIKIGTGSAAKTVSQFAVPLVVVVPITSRFNIDVATAYASSDVSANGASASSISGLTDTQVRANWTLGNDAVVITAGLNIPTGQYTIPEANVEAAGQIGNDFLIFPISTYGAGLSGTGGVAVAKSLGDWNLGIAASARHGAQFDAFTAQNRVLTFTPADEYRARVGLDRAVGEGRVSIGVTYSDFGKDVYDATSYATGSRIIGQASWYAPIGTTDLFVSGWGLHRASGQQFGGPSDPETVADGAVSLGFHSGNLLIEPNIEGRNWQVNGTKAGMLGSGGLRLRFPVGSLSVLPSFTYQVGKLYSTSDGSSTDLAGWRTSLMIRLK